MQTGVQSNYITCSTSFTLLAFTGPYWLYRNGAPLGDETGYATAEDEGRLTFYACDCRD